MPVIATDYDAIYGIGRYGYARYGVARTTFALDGLTLQAFVASVKANLAKRLNFTRGTVSVQSVIYVAKANRETDGVTASSYIGTSSVSGKAVMQALTERVQSHLGSIVKRGKANKSLSSVSTYSYLGISLAKSTNTIRLHGNGATVTMANGTQATGMKFDFGLYADKISKSRSVTVA